MIEIRTRIDDVLEFIWDKRVTTLNEVSEQVGVKGDRLELYIDILQSHRLIEVKHVPLGPMLYCGEETIVHE